MSVDLDINIYRKSHENAYILLLLICVQSKRQENGHTSNFKIKNKNSKSLVGIDFLFGLYFCFKHYEC